MTEVKFENSISRLTAVANPRQIERAVRGSIFELDLIYEVEDEKEMIEDVVGEIDVDPAVYMKPSADIVPKAPGMKYKHYAPKADVTLLDGTFEQFKAYVDAHADQNPSCLCFTGEAEKLGWPCVEYGREGDGADQAKHIFRSLRALDEQGDGVVYARCPKKDGLSMAVYNRLIRAAAFRVIQL